MAHLLDTLQVLASLDLVIASDLTELQRQEIRERWPGSRVLGMPEAFAQRRFGRLRWATDRQLPLRPAITDPLPARRAIAAFARGAPGPPSAIWSFGAIGSWLARPVVPDIPVLVDLPDITSVRHDRLLAAERADRDRSFVRGRRRELRHLVERARWARFERAEAGHAALATVCSETDRELLEVPDVAVVPNGYDAPREPLGPVEVGERPMILFVGQLRYEPNAAGITWFVEEVFPSIRERVTDARLEIVGESVPAVEALAARPGVEVLGRVENLDAHLARAAVAIAPLWQGSGTRIKILEAFAHRIPVVSTTIGVEGIDAVDGRHLLRRDEATTFADAVVRLLIDGPLRAKVSANAHELYLCHYEWRIVQHRFETLVRDVLMTAHRIGPSTTSTAAGPE